MKTRITIGLACMILAMSWCAARVDAQDFWNSPVWQEEVNIDAKDLSLGKMLEIILEPTAT